MPTNHFCCCLPLRLGALLISFCQLILCGLIAAAGGLTWANMRGQLPTVLKAIIVSFTFYYLVLAFASLIGLIGTLGRKARLLSTYASYLGYSIVIQIIIDGVYLWAFFSKSRSDLISRCIDGSTDQEVENICNSFFNSGKWPAVGGMIIGLSIQSWASHTVSSYAKKLQDDKWRSGDGVAVPLVNNSGPKYTHVGQEDESYGASYAQHQPSRFFAV